ncbi:MAG TPA: type I DNA topoisomerase [bacterium]|nr:type I DNA topoisomerase [bacterium]
MAKTLVIVESPAKARTINKFLGKEYLVKSSMGHIKDLPRKELGVDLDRDFTPHYCIISSKAETLKKLKELAKGVQRVYLAPDPDREGEAISWHLYNELKGITKDIKRIVFHEITKEAIKEALSHPREVDQRLVNAQQARRILDRIVGYKISPLLWRKVRKGLSAGRVQSVTLRLICEREKEIKSFKPEEYWSIHTRLQGKSKEIFKADLNKIEDKRLKVSDQIQAQEISSQLEKEKFILEKIIRREKKRFPLPPFITSTLQQEAVWRFHWKALRTMRIAQQLYEGLDIGGGETVGLITYMRTDSFQVALSAIKEVREYIRKESGKDFLPSRPRYYKSRKRAQEAHEAIRPTSCYRTPERLREHLTLEQYRLYSLIWNRFLASQMKEALLEKRTFKIRAGKFFLSSSDSRMRFEGFLSLYPGDKAFKEKPLPALKEKEALKLLEVLPAQHFTQPPPRFSEASLIKTLEEEGIGRPSTYASIMEVIRSRDYVESHKGNFHPTPLGEMVIELLIKSFPDILNVKFTSQMEERLDKVEEGKEDWVNLLHSFYGPFASDLSRAQKEMRYVKKELEEKTDKICEKCGSPMVIKHGRFGKFLACSSFPKCKNSRPLTIGIDCPKKGCDGEIVQRRTKRRRTFYGCSNYPECNLFSWDRPTGKSCPECDSFLVERYSKSKGRYIKCANKDCSYSEQIISNK